MLLLPFLPDKKNFLTFPSLILSSVTLAKIKLIQFFLKDYVKSNKINSIPLLATMGNHGFSPTQHLRHSLFCLPQAHISPPPASSTS